VKLLLVEDDTKIATTLRRGLEAEGFVVDLALDGDDGIWKITERDYDLILLDLMLPRRNGFKVCAEARAAGVWTPILVLTAKDGVYDETEALDTGADDFLSKPFAFEVLVSRIHALLRRSSGRPPTTALEVDDLRLDPQRHECRRGEVTVSLTSRELAVLEFLMRRAGMVLTKAAILDGVWDESFDGDPNIVEVYIARLRRKVDEPFGRHNIRTIRGAGYRLESDRG
jgi:two-component system OmpR family response regulator